MLSLVSMGSDIHVSLTAPLMYLQLKWRGVACPCTQRWCSQHPRWESDTAAFAAASTHWMPSTYAHTWVCCWCSRFKTLPGLGSGTTDAPHNAD